MPKHDGLDTEHCRDCGGEYAVREAYDEDDDHIKAFKFACSDEDCTETLFVALLYYPNDSYEAIAMVQRGTCECGRDANWCVDPNDDVPERYCMSCVPDLYPAVTRDALDRLRES